MKVRTSELIDAALDWAVGITNGGLYQSASARDAFWIWPGEPVKYSKASPAYSTDWAQGGPIIEREGITLRCGLHGWDAELEEFDAVSHGPTPLIAAMRCYCCSKLGDEIDIPGNYASRKTVNRSGV